MRIIRAGERATQRAEAAYFAGDVIIEPVLVAPEPASLRALVVTFLPGGRTHWHHHVMGQTLYVTSGIGRIRMEGGPLHEIRAGDTVWIPPGVVHWHGAAPDHAMSHIAMQEEPEGRVTTWLGPVEEADYTAAPEG